MAGQDKFFFVLRLTFYVFRLHVLSLTSTFFPLTRIYRMKRFAVKTTRRAS